MTTRSAFPSVPLTEATGRVLVQEIQRLCRLIEGQRDTHRVTLAEVIERAKVSRPRVLEAAASLGLPTKGRKGKGNGVTYSPEDARAILRQIDFLQTGDPEDMPEVARITGINAGRRRGHTPSNTAPIAVTSGKRPIE